MAEVSKGTQVPCPGKKVLPAHKHPPFHTRVTPINFFAFGAEWENNVVDELIDNHIFSECQGKSLDLKVARPVNEKIDPRLKSYKVVFVRKK